ncbi:hypothetical protein OCF84_21355 (plasmid) [Shewanella xiamenensis]|uniref:Uncharacterized protein n=1 Tax=Shewanella xiamenensis TaxID=332186 RepID=A0ABT6UDN0_9GAMM|nr:hypothetical protein [Shewanella xiamenensis]MDI5832575.1 hypothetical protein [Shewanella xiamenensis]WHF57806.1 hypothetical protein OCF84_21355 [Shewanella xiamenensis]
MNPDNLMPSEQKAYDLVLKIGAARANSIIEKIMARAAKRHGIEESEASFFHLSKTEGSIDTVLTLGLRVWNCPINAERRNRARVIERNRQMRIRKAQRRLTSMATAATSN